MSNNKKLDLSKFIKWSQTTNNEFLNNFITTVFNNFVSDENNYTVSGTIGKPMIGSPQILQNSFARQLNEIDCAISTKIGAEEKIATFEDMITRLKMLGVDLSGLIEDFSEIAYNFSPPINVDKFLNFKNYYWVKEELIINNELSWNLQSIPEYYVIQRSSNSNTWNDWQLSNKWIHKDDTAFANGTYDIDNCIQAQFPIIEYSMLLELNNKFANGIPTQPSQLAAENNFIQRKFEKNQLPLFNLYYSDGTHSGVVGSIFKYMNITTGMPNDALGIRTNVNSVEEILLDVDVYDDSGALLYYKKNDQIVSIWTKTNESETLSFKKKDANSNVIDYPGGYVDGVIDGAWKTPQRIFRNLERSALRQVSVADLIPHFMSIRSVQAADYFDMTGGGCIRDYGSMLPLLISLLNQDDISIPSIIEFAEKQYKAALSGAESYLLAEFARLIGGDDSPSLLQLDQDESFIDFVLNKLEQSRINDQLINSTFSDTTCKIKSWPITLPMIGLVKAVNPKLNHFDFELGINSVLHHDGHISPMIVDDFQASLFVTNTFCQRSDGTNVAGVVSITPPTSPYARQLWLNPSTKSLKFFNVRFDLTTQPFSINEGEYWFNRESNVLYKLVNANWVVQPSQEIANRWHDVDLARMRNGLTFAIEQKLYDSVPSYFIENDLAVDIKDIAENTEIASLELSRFSQKYNYDTFAPDFNQADAFTWNYLQANIPGIEPKARWFDVYLAYFSAMAETFNIIPTSRPNLEPWKLLGIPSSESMYTFNGITQPFINHFAKNSSDTNRRLWKAEMWSHIQSLRPGLKLCVYSADSPTLSDTLLPPYVSNQAAPEFQQNALFVTATLPDGISNPYTFGQNGPIESVWKKSLEYNYGLAISAFRLKPLSFIDRAWGVSYVTAESNSLRVERNIGRSPSHREMLLHGERQDAPSLSPTEVAERLGNFSIQAGEKIAFRCVSFNNEAFFELYDKSNRKVSLVRNGQGTGYVGINDEVSIPSFGIDSLVIKSLGHVFQNGEVMTVENNGAIKYTHQAAVRKSYQGLGQLFVNTIRYSFGNEEISQIMNMFRNWQSKICHRFSSNIIPDSILIRTGDGVIKPDFFTTKLVRNEKTQVKRITALRVQLVDMGSIIDNDGELTRERNNDGSIVPTKDASSWIFRIEGYDASYPLINYFAPAIDSDYEKFVALNGSASALSWKKYSMLEDSPRIIQFPHLITGLQSLIDVIFGYVAWLKKQGWTTGIKDLTNIDKETGLSMSWQLEVEKLIDKIYSGMSAGEGFILNPFMNELTIETPIGLLSAFDDNKLADGFLTQVANDVIGGKIPLSSINVIRADDKSTFRSNTPMYSARVYIDEFEHILIFNDTYTTNGLTKHIFNRTNGSVEETFVLKYNKQDSLDKKPILGGYLMNGDSFTRNIMSDIDKIGNFYDSNLTFSDPVSRKHSLALLGFNKKTHFENLSLDEKTQFNFWKGLIQGKGTNISLDAFLNHKESVNAQADEIWAYKIATFGDAREKTFPELKVNSVDCAQLFTRLQFFNQTIENYKLLQIYTHIAADDDTRWFSIDDLGTDLKFETRSIGEKIEATEKNGYPKYMRLKNIYINDGAAPFQIKGPGMPKVINSNLVLITAPGTYTVSGHTWITPTKLSPIKLFDYTSNTMIEEIGLWHPALGINAYRPMEIINVISKENPAFYTNSLTITLNPNLRKLKPWGKSEVGTVWWNTLNLDYVPYYDAKIFPNRQTRETLWGAIADWSSIELYEWTESDVHPSEYDELAREQEGRIETINSVKASGRVAVKRLYTRNRIIEMRPVAWSQIGNAIGDAHPSFGSAVFSTVYVVGNSLVAEQNSLTNLNILPGMHFSGWKNDAPVGEVVIGASNYFILGSSTSINAPIINAVGPVTATIRIIDDGLFGVNIGRYSLTKRIDRTTDTVIGVEGNIETVITERIYLRMSDDKGNQEEIELSDWYSYDNVKDNSLTLSFETLGLQLMITRKETAPQKLLARELVATIIDGSHDIVVREGINFSEIISLPDTIFINDKSDPDYFLNEYEWRCWAVPTQDDLNNDMRYEPRKWKAYPGTFMQVQASPQVLQMIKEDTPLVTNDGASYSRFSTSWTVWSELFDEVHEKISNGRNNVSIEFSNTIEASRLLVFINGQRSSPEIVITGNTVTLSNVVGEGYVVRAIHKKHEPSEEEINFVPEIADDIMVAVNYKQDYEYSEEIRRDDNGNAIGKKYYFWVKDKSTLHLDKNISLLQAKKMIMEGDSQYAILSNAVNVNGSCVFDSCIIRGLNYLVTKDNSYKLRFTRDFTLRDDPEEMSLKNVHTQWQLLRRGQTEKIPSVLWKKLTEAVCEQDDFGNALPNSSRIAYDLKNNTKTRFGFGSGQIIADSTLIKESILNSILNTSLQISVGKKRFPFFISALDFSKRDDWFNGPEKSRGTMEYIWKMASVKQINDIFFNAMEDAYSSSLEIGDLMKTSMIHITIQRDI